jgi:hypothetical protein
MAVNDSTTVAITPIKGEDTKLTELTNKVNALTAVVGTIADAAGTTSVVALVKQIDANNPGA